MKVFKHPSDVCMTYIEHMKFALNLSFELLIGSIQSTIHAFIPDMYVTSTTDLVTKLDKMLKESGCKDE